MKGLISSVFLICAFVSMANASCNYFNLDQRCAARNTIWIKSDIFYCSNFESIHFAFKSINLKFVEIWPSQIREIHIWNSKKCFHLFVISHVNESILAELLKNFDLCFERPNLSIIAINLWVWIYLLKEKKYPIK